jgi:hypothetical protein
MRFSEYENAIMEGGHELDKSTPSNSVDLSFISSLVESKFFLNPANAHVIDDRDLAEITFVAILCLYILYETPHTRRTASVYANSTTKWDQSGTYAKHRIQATDLYISLQALHDYEKSQISGQLKKNPDINALQLHQMRIKQTRQPVKQFLQDISYYQLTDPPARFFFNLETQLYITDVTVKNIRRSVSSWKSLSKSEKIYTVSRLTLWLKRHAPKYDLNSLMNQLLDARDIDVK